MSMPATDALYRRSIVVDACAPVAPFSFIEATLVPDEALKPYSEAGVTLVIFSVADDFPNSIEQTIKLIGQNCRYILTRPDRFVLADQSSQVRKAKAEGKLAVGFAFQGSNALLGELSLVEVYRRLGVVQMLLAYNKGNLAADGCHERRNAGLTQFGRDLVAEMNRVGMIVDVTHMGLRSSLEALELTTRPPIFSHSTPKKFLHHDRNITDEQIRACAGKDGVICLAGIGLFMDGETRKATALRLVETIEYVVQLVGPQHTGIGLDSMDSALMARFFHANRALYSNDKQYPSDGYIDMLPPSNLPWVTEELSRRGLSDSDIRGILGENYLRVLEANA